MGRFVNSFVNVHLRFELNSPTTIVVVLKLGRNESYDYLVYTRSTIGYSITDNKTF